MREKVRAYNVGSSDYAKRTIQPWDIKEEVKLHRDIIIYIQSLKDKYDTRLLEEYIDIQRRNWSIQMEEGFIEQS